VGFLGVAPRVQLWLWLEEEESMGGASPRALPVALCIAAPVQLPPLTARVTHA
jgi:hypothetical protein